MPTHVGVFTHHHLPEGGPATTQPCPGSGSLVTIGSWPSLDVRVLEAPGLHSSDKEVLRAERLVVESVAVARAAPVQVPVDVQRLAAPSTCGTLGQWLPAVKRCPGGPSSCF